jgi:hypothetical protein
MSEMSLLDILVQLRKELKEAYASRREGTLWTIRGGDQAEPENREYIGCNDLMEGWL